MTFDKAAFYKAVLSDMPPCFAASDATYGGVMNSTFLCDYHAASRVNTDRPDSAFCQLSIDVLAANLGGPVHYGVGPIR